MLLGAAIIVLANGDVLAQSYSPSALPDRIVLTWTDDPATTQAVTWRTDATVTAAGAQIAPLRPSPDLADHARFVEATTQSVTFEQQDSHYHSVTFTGLEPATRYAYRVGDGTQWSEWFHFRTAAVDAEPFTFVYFGDAQNDIKEYWSRTIRAAYAHNPDIRFFVHAGDLGLSSEGDRSWAEWFHAGSWIHATVPSVPAPGNSDHFRLDDEDMDRRLLYPQYRHNFALPQHGPEGMEGLAYYVDYQGLRVISLYSNFESMDPGEREILIDEETVLTDEMVERQTRWLESVLADNPNHWTAVTFHHPIFSPRAGRDNERLRDMWRPLFAEYGVDLVLQGHDHLYARGRDPELTPGTGPVYVISIAGPKMREIGERAAWIEHSGENIQLYQLITVSPERLEYRSYSVDGELFDSFDLTKPRDTAAARP